MFSNGTLFVEPALYMLRLLLNIDIKALLLGDEDWGFLPETAFRTCIMFIVIVLGLRMLGKRGVKQLSVFELGVIIGLGSAAGDPMFYKDVGLLPGFIVFTIVLGFYRLITYLINRSDHFEQFMEGTPTCILRKGKFLVQQFEKEPIARDEFYSQLRLRGVSHLGQLEQAIIETNGEASLFYYPDEEVHYGLPVLPDLCAHPVKVIPIEAHYACIYCGHAQHLQPAPQHHCEVCNHDTWVKAINSKRVK